MSERERILIDVNPFFPLALNVAKYLELSNWDVYLSPTDYYTGPQFMQTFAKKYNFKVLGSFNKVEIPPIDMDNLAIKRMAAIFREVHMPKNSIDQKIRDEYSQICAGILENRINYVLVQNGAQSIIEYVAKKLKLKIYYMENGYFPKTLQVDSRGVNIDASFADMDYEEFLDYSVPKNSSIKKITSFSVHPYPLSICELGLATIKQFLDYWQRYGFKYAMFWISYMTQLYNLYVNTKSKQIHERIVLPKKYIFIPLQVHNDTQVLFNSPFDNMEEFIDTCYAVARRILPDFEIVVKEHPMDVTVNYDGLRRKYPSIIWLKNYDINQVIDYSSYVFVINSSVGLQALAKYKKVLVFGSCFYARNPFVETANDNIMADAALERLKSKTLDKSCIDRYIAKFKEIFIEGSFFSFDEDTVYAVCGRLL